MSSSLTASASLKTNQRPWIVSAWWDLTYLVVTPLLIVPVVLILARHWFTAEQVSVAVIAYASLGHHLPGFMRAYGDRDLFLRYRWRFLLVPPMVFGLALLFSPPKPVAELFHLPWTHLHGLELILLFWGTWHGLMQTYGFMRIYDVRLGVNDRWSARLDHWLCVIVFVAGVVFSDARVFGIAKGMWQSGLPLFGPEVLLTVRYLVAAAGIFILLLYTVNLINRRKSGQPVSWIKLWLVGITGWFYWYTGRLSTNVLIGLAMFEIYHAVQYYAIVWIYNRRLFERTGNRFGPLGFLFRDRLTMLGLYLATIAAYSSIRFFTVDANGYVFRGGSQEAYQWLVAMFVTSSFLHFYFDGFIWKVSEKKTQENLVDAVPEGTPLTHYVPGLVHAGKWAFLLAIAGGLLYSEWRKRDEWNVMKADRIAALVRLTPELPESQMLLSEQALATGDPRSAITHAQRALELRPRSHNIHAVLGTALAETGRVTEARAALEQAIAIAPDRWDYHSQLAQVLARLGDLELAEQEHLKAVELGPDQEQPRQALVQFYLSQNRNADAEAELQAIAERFPNSDFSEINRVFVLLQQGKTAEATQLATFLVAGHPQDWRVQLALGSALNAAGDFLEAQTHLLKALEGNRNESAIYYQLGMANFYLEQYSPAAQFLRKAQRLNPHDAQISLQLGNSYYVLRKLRPALEAYRAALKLSPDRVENYTAVAAVLLDLGQSKESRETLQQGLEVDPNSAALHYNLGLTYLREGDVAEARKPIERAIELGLEPSPEVRAALGLENPAASAP